MAEVDGLGVAAVLAANADLQVRSTASTVFDSNPHQAAYPGLIDCLERVGWHDVMFGVVTDEAFVVVSTDPQTRLSQIIRTKTEELSGFGNLTRGQSGSWNFDHRSGYEVDRYALFVEHFLSRFLMIAVWLSTSVL